MVITRLIGGLGNQMFQYAAVRRLAHVMEAELKLEISYFPINQHMVPIVRLLRNSRANSMS